MKNFEYAQPRSEAEAVALLSDKSKRTAVLAGGTDLVGLMKRMVVSPDRVVNICEIESLQRMRLDDKNNLWIGAAVHLDQFFDDSRSDAFPSVKQVIQGISSVQLQAQGTLVGELLRRPRCWYFREGHGLLAEQGRMIVEGDNRYHAILGNRGPAKFVSASRLAPALICLEAMVRVIGPGESEQFIPLEELYQIPQSSGEPENALQPGQLVTHIILPPTLGKLSAAYEVRHGEGPDQPLAAAAVSLQVKLGIVQQAMIVVGQVAPVPWSSVDASHALQGQRISEETATLAGFEAVAGAMALSHNQYKIQLAQVAVKRAILRAAGLETGGLDRPLCGESSSEATNELNTSSPASQLV